MLSGFGCLTLQRAQKMGSNAQTGLDNLLPPVPGLNAEQRLSCAYETTLPLVEELLGHRVLGLIPVLNIQAFAHQCCDFTQQTGRLKQQSRRTPRSDEELRRFAAEAFPRLAPGAPPLPTLPRPVLSDKDAFSLLRQTFPEALLPTGGWDAEMLRSRLHFARSSAK